MMGPSTKDLPGSGTIRLSEIKTEFGKGNNLLDYLGEGGVTSSAPLKLTDFYGASSAPPPFGISGQVPNSLTGGYYKPNFHGSSGTLPYDSYLGDTVGGVPFDKLGFLRGSGDYLVLRYAIGQSRVGAEYSNMKIVSDGLGTVYDGVFYDNGVAEYYTGQSYNFLTTPPDLNGSESWQLVINKAMTVTLSSTKRLGGLKDLTFKIRNIPSSTAETMEIPE